ncbi:hypothetical protein G6F49_002442 [Rhizopus delemar]|nr:hypothetical protein G6F36_013372 [Rhizopus arrhizus]KAG1499669.1 hypothetical protein G6F54_004254 [Rhizopus delemar]KAG1560732.1 hypothetical protein G6F49_002442 [Rhizopus delemar]KAG1643054.1 hypothetical protein G6F44_004218 [Rhizopus delemar]
MILMGKRPTQEFRLGFCERALLGEQKYQEVCRKEIKGILKKMAEPKLFSKEEQNNANYIKGARTARAAIKQAYF